MPTRKPWMWKEPAPGLMESSGRTEDVMSATAAAEAPHDRDQIAKPPPRPAEPTQEPALASAGIAA